MKTFSNNFIYIKFEWNRSCPHNLPFFSFTFLSPSTNSKILTTHYSLNNYSLSSLFISLLTPSLSKFSHLIPFPILTIPSLLQPSHLFPIFPSLSFLPYSYHPFPLKILSFLPYSHHPFPHKVTSLPFPRPAGGWAHPDARHGDRDAEGGGGVFAPVGHHFLRYAGEAAWIHPEAWCPTQALQ